MNNFNLGDIVYYITDEHNEQYMIVAITTTIDGGVNYTLSRNGLDCEAYGLEISKTKNIE